MRRASEVAEANGELSGALHNLREERNGYPARLVVFNVQCISTKYSTSYVVCQAFPTFKIDNRCFQLEKIEAKGSTFFRPDAKD